MSDDQPGWTAPGGAPTPSPSPGSSPGPPPPAPGPGAPGGRPYGGPTEPLYAEYRPGIVAIRPLTLSDIFGGATLAIRGNPAATLGLGLVTTLAFVIPATAVGALLTSVLVDQVGVDSTTGQDALDGLGSAGSLLPAFGGQLAVLVMTAFAAHVIGQGVLGRKVSLGETWQAARSRIWPVIGSAVLIGLLVIVLLAVVIGIPAAILVYGLVQHVDGTAVLGGILLFFGVLVGIAGALFISTRFAFAAAAIVLEHLGVRGGLSRSWRLTTGTAFWRILGIRILVGVLVAVVSAILSVPIGAITGLAVGAAGLSAATFAVVTVLINALSTVVTGALTTPFSAGTDTLLYIDQRIRREGLDVQLIAAAQGGR